MAASDPPPGLYISEAQGVGSIAGVTTSVAAFVGFCSQGPVDQAQPVRSWREYELLFGGLDGEEMGYAVASFYENGGGEAWVVRVLGPPSGDGLGLIGDASSRTGLHALEGAGAFNLLCLPDARRLTGDAHTAVAAAGAAYCRMRRAFLVLDLPAGVDTIEAAQGWVTDDAPKLGSENSSYAAAYWPEPLVADPLDAGRARRIAASGTMAAVYACCDRDRGVWQAPAGITRSIAGVLDLAVNLTDAENGLINPLGLNALRTFPVYGTVPWGGRTLQGADSLASDWKYIPVRRLALYIEESLAAGLAWTVFEPSSERLWTTVRRAADDFLNGLWRQGGLSGASPKSAYFVKCDSTTTTMADIEAGRLNLVIGFAPIRPAEFLVIQLQLTVGPIEA